MKGTRMKQLEVQINRLFYIVDAVHNIFDDEWDDPQTSDQTLDYLDDAERYISKAIDSLEYAEG